ncbi:MAG: ABC transporter ATP-binding protein [Ferruginibacter sp.]|nr:ABC transporter ATP-binding protein [Ferruginibacter sp.]
MAATATQNIFANPVKRILKVIELEKNEISSVYFYAILNGLIQLSLPLGIQSIISFVLGGAITTSLVVLICLVVLGVFLNGMLQVNQMRLIEKVEQKIFVRYSFEFAERIPKLNLQAVDGYYLPELINRFFDTVSLQKGISKLLLDIPTATIQIVFGLVLLSFYHPVFIFFGLLLVLIVYVVLKITSAKGMESSLQESDYKYAVAGWLQEMARVVKSFKFAKHTSLNIQKTDRLVTGYLHHRTTHFKILLWQYWSLIGFKVLITAAMLIVGSVLLVSQQLNIGQFIAAEIIILMVITSVEKLIVSLDKVYDVLTSVEKLGKVTDKPTEEEGTVDLKNEQEGLSVEMNRVNFNYQDKEHTNQNTLSDISITIEKNEKVCIMGRGGAGKSTLLRLLTGSYKNFSGTLLINNIPVINYRLQSLREQTGILFNQQDIFEGTLLENITMGWPDISGQHILEVAEKIGLKKYFSGLPQGFNTPLDPAGKKMPQKIIQKILLLRALINNPRLVLLEEPFNGIEEEIQHQIIDYLLHQTPHQTLLVISNDQAFAAQCDKVIFMQDGAIKAMGNWSSVQSSIKN